MASSSPTSTSVSFSAFTSTPAIATEKLVGSSNYVSWSKAVEKWCIGQGLKNHLYTKPEDVKDEKERENFERSDALLCTLLWQSIDPSLHNIYTNFDTCCELWTQAKSLYTNDIQRLYSVVDKLINLRQQGITISELVGQMSSIKAEFNALLPAGKPIVEDLAQREKFFMVCTLAALSTDLASVRDQILASPSIPNLDEVFSQLLRVTSIAPPSPVAPETSALVSTNVHRGPREEQGGNHRGGSDSSRPRCTYCHRWGHTKDKCFKLHGRPRVNLAHNDDTLPEQSRDSPVQQSITLTGTDYDDYLRYRASQQSSTSTASVAHSASFLDSHELSDHSKAFIQDDDLQAPTQVSDSKSRVSQKSNNSAVPARPAFHFSPTMVQGHSTETKDLASGKSNVVQKFDLTLNSEIKSTPVMSLPQKSMISTYSTAETPLSLIKSSEMPITNSKMTMATSFTMGDKLSGAFTPESWRKNFPSSESHSSTISPASTLFGKVTEFNFDKSWPENNSPAVPKFSGSCESLSSPTNITPSVSSVSSSVSSAAVPPAAVSVTSSSSMTSSNTSIDSNYMSTSSASDFLCLSNQAPKQTSSSLPNPPSLNSTSESLKSETQPAAMPNLKTDLDAAAGVVTQLNEPLNGESELKLGSSRKFSPTDEQSSNIVTSSKINTVSVSQSEQPSDAPLQLSTSFLASTSVSSGKNGGFDVGISQEDEMEEEAPETNNATEHSLGSLGGFGISSTPNPSMPKSNPFGGSFNNNAATSLSSSTPTFSVPSGELFRPASFSFPSPQSSAPTQSTNSGAFSGGFGVGAAVPAQAPSAFGQPAQIGSGQQVLGSVLGTFGQSRQLGSGLTGSGFAAPTGFGGGFGGSSSTSGFSNAGGGFAGIASTGGGFGGIASTGGGFAGIASTSSGCSGFASPVCGFSGAASTGGGGFAAVSSTGGFAGAGSGGGFGALSNQGSGGFAAFGNVGGNNKPPELFTQMRK